MRAAGLSPVKLAKPAFAMAGVVTAAGFLLSLEIAPGANRELVSIRKEIRSEYSSVLLREGTYNDIGDGLTVYVRQRDDKGELSGLLIQDSRRPERPTTIMAERGVLVTAEAGPRVIVFNGTQLEFHPDTGEVDTLDFARYTIDLKVLKDSDADRWPDPRERPTGDLLFVGSDQLDQVLISRLKAELHNRLATPLFAIGFTMIALAALLSGEFSRRGQARRIMAAVIAAIALEALVLAVSNLISKNMALTPLLYLIVLTPIVLGYWYMRRWRAVRRALFRFVPAE
jgi:lipopolysaccharide export system permease protein